LNIIDYNNAFPGIIKSQGKLAGKNILDFLIFNSSYSSPFRVPPPEEPQRLIFISPDNSSFSLDCNIYHIEENYLVIGGHLMVARDEIIEKMSFLSNELINMTRELHNQNTALEEAHAQIKVLSGLIPICMYCKEIRDDEGYWNQLEKFITKNSEAFFTHGICPKCLGKHFPDLTDDD
jgi:Zn finger protein HypA/HybF involved in hydrogenase expression